MVTAAVFSGLSGCVMTNGPVETPSGFRLDGSALVVAMPVCRDETITGSEIVVRGEGGFETLWSAREPRTAQAREGVFQVNSPRDFVTVTKELSGSLPKTFYLELVHIRDGEEATRSGYVDLDKARSAGLADGEFVTHKGEVMTRAEINAQLSCNKKR
ncbi:hypothetical protein [Streptomyces cyaneofuscatus]|uniref:hypothetical protein n=1 Tax=Streptomyces cyaneofuscatus TaxID=66883 RepID=UPI003414A938